MLEALIAEMSTKEWLQTLLADINNQGDSTNRLVDRECIFKWCQENLGSSFDPNLIFYDEDRNHEFEGQSPAMPTEKGKYQPFLSCKVLIQLLLLTGFLAIRKIH